MKIIRILALLLLTLAVFTGCKPSGSNGENNGGGGSSSNGNATFDVGEQVYVVTCDGLDVTDIGIDKLIGDAIGESCVSYITDSASVNQSEITIGSCNREISTIGYNKLSSLSCDSDKIRYGIYSSGDSVAIVYDELPGFEKQIITCAFELFCQLYVKDNSPICIENGEFESARVSISDLQEMKNSDSWVAFESAVGVETAGILKQMYSDLYKDEMVDFIASLYDNSYGGFYYSPSAKESLGFETDEGYFYSVPDISSTLMAISFIEKSGMICGYDSINEALPKWMCDQMDRFVASNQSDLPQREVSESIIDQFNASCDPTSGLWSGELNPDMPEKIIELLDIYSVYEKFGASIPYPEKAVNSLISTLKKANDSSAEMGVYCVWKAICSITSNLEKHNPDGLANVRRTLYDNSEELIGKTEEFIRNRLRIDGSFANPADIKEGNTISTVILSTEIIECIFNSFGTPVITIYTRADLQGFVNEVSRNRILYVYATSEQFYQGGAVNYKIYSYRNADGIDEPAIFIYDAEKYSGEKLQRTILTYIINTNDGITAGLSIDKLDYYYSVIFDNKFSYHYAGSETEVKEGYVNYRITPYSSKDTVIKIYNSYLIKDEADMREILTHLITSEAGAKAELSLADLDYYVIEWKAHNIMYENPSVIPFMNKDEVKKRAKDVDLNTDDSYASIYSSIVSMYG